MIVRFTVSNFRSFGEEVSFSMIPGRSIGHDSHIIRAVKPNDIDVLRTGLIYGANASGKSNLVKALDFMRKLVLDSPRPNSRILLQQFKLWEENKTNSSKFELEFIINNQAYIYGFEITTQKIISESLYSSTEKSERVLFKRTTEDTGKASVRFYNLSDKSKENKDFLKFVARSTRPNQLFLSKALDDNVDEYKNIYRWFGSVLKIVYPTSRLTGVQIAIENDKVFSKNLSSFLTDMSTGVKEVHLKEVPIDSLPEGVISDIIGDLSEEKGMAVDVFPLGRFIVNLNKNNDVKVSGLAARHLRADGTDVIFDWQSEESDGTQRLLDLFPVLHTEKNDTEVFIIDEIDRSLHPNLVREFIKLYLGRDHSACQLIMSTHDATLLDLDLLRRDEYWFVEKDPSTGQSEVYSLEEFKPRNDRKIGKGYLNGRYGAIPAFGNVLKDQISG